MQYGLRHKKKNIVLYVQWGARSPNRIIRYLDVNFTTSTWFSTNPREAELVRLYPHGDYAGSAYHDYEPEELEVVHVQDEVVTAIKVVIPTLHAYIQYSICLKPSDVQSNMQEEYINDQSLARNQFNLKYVNYDLLEEDIDIKIKKWQIKQSMNKFFSVSK
jgi:hypothetical protein